MNYELRFCEPLVLRCIEAGGLVPGIAGEVADHPDIAHLIARGHNLMMVVAVGDVGGTALHTLIYIVTHEAGTEALGLVKLIVIYLGLRVVVGGIA